MPPRPAVRWEWLLAWAKANGIPDDALVTDEWDRAVFTARYWHGTLYVDAGARPRYPPLTWERLRAMCAEMGVQAGSELWFDGHLGSDAVKVLALGGEEGPDENGVSRLVLQRRWG